MKFQIVIEGETDDVENAQLDDGPVKVFSRTMEDVVKVVETALPYMLDNVVVTSKLV